MRHARMIRLPFALALLGPMATGAVLVVDDTPGPGVDFAQISTAVAAAAEGDILLVKTGSYLPFTITNRSLVVIGDQGAVVNVAGTIRIASLVAGKSVTLRNLSAIGGTAALDEGGLVVTQCAGAVRVENCVLTGAPGKSILFSPTNGTAGARIDGSLDVAITRSQLIGGAGASVGDPGFIFPTGGGFGLRASSSLVVVHDSTLAGGKGGNDSTAATPGQGGHGEDGARVEGGAALLAGCNVTGGAGGFGGFGLFDVGGDGGDGLEYSGGATVRTLDSTFSGGAGGVGFPPGVDGLPTRSVLGTHIAWPGSARHFEIDAPVREGANVNLTFDGEPFETALFGVSLSATQATFDAHTGALLLGAPIVFFVLGATDAAGGLTLPAIVPQLAPSLEGVSLHVQGFFSGPGASVIGAFSECVLLDSQF